MKGQWPELRAAKAIKERIFGHKWSSMPVSYSNPNEVPDMRKGEVELPSLRIRQLG